MKRNSRARLIGLIVGLALAAAGAARAAPAKCQLIFEAIPSKDAAPIIGAEVNHEIAGKDFVAWSGFTREMAGFMFSELPKLFPRAAVFENVEFGIGGFEGKSSPNARILVLIDASGDELGKAVFGVSAAVGYVFVQDAVVAYCDTDLGQMGGTFPLYPITPGQGFRTNVPSRFALRAYSAMVQANNDPNIGYSLFNKESMQVLDVSGSDQVPLQVERTNEFLAKTFNPPVLITAGRPVQQSSAYVDNNWVRNPKGRKFLILAEKVKAEVSSQLVAAQARYLTALWQFANPPSEE